MHHGLLHGPGLRLVFRVRGEAEFGFPFGQVCKFKIYSPMNLLRDLFDQLKCLKNNIIKGARRRFFKFFNIFRNVLKLLFGNWRIDQIFAHSLLSEYCIIWIQHRVALSPIRELAIFQLFSKRHLSNLLKQLNWVKFLFLILMILVILLIMLAISRGLDISYLLR